MNSRYFINPSSEDVARALDSWHWLDIQGKRVLLITAFADVFFSAPDGIWALDTLEGELKRLCETQIELEAALQTEEMEDTYLMGPLIEYLVKSGLTLSATQCYDYKVHPRLGGQINHENIEVRSFVVALNLRGQLHEHVRHMKPGTKISSVEFQEEPKAKPWWKLWH
jgi:hypothetical protein